MCLECGKCSASCPRMLTGKEYSPRLLAHKLIAEPDSESFIENSVWECLTCGLCEERCPSGVQVSRFIMEMRTLLAGTKGLKGYRSHDGALHSWMRLMTSPDLEQNRLDWLGAELKVAQSGPLAFFTGCAPYFDVFFSGIEVNTLSIVRDSIRLLNFLDIVPVVLEKERCCGHDLLWTGDRENFETLCRLNYKEFQAAGVEEVVVSCPECYQVLGQFMPEVIPDMKLKVTLLSDLLRREISKGGVTFKPLKRRATYQDPCRLGRTAGSCETPRALIQMIPELGFQRDEELRQGRDLLREQRVHQLRRLLEADPGGTSAGGQGDAVGSPDHRLPQVHDPSHVRHARSLPAWFTLHGDPGPGQCAGRSDRVVQGRRSDRLKDPVM